MYKRCELRGGIYRIKNCIIKLHKRKSAVKKEGKVLFLTRSPTRAANKEK